MEVHHIFNAVYSANLPLLKNLLCPLTKSEIKELTSYLYDGTTLLLTAARYGHYQIMKFLIEYCDVDIEQVGIIEIDGETVHDTPPLWCAAAAGNLCCVKLLLEHGANVNCTTHTNSTPLRTACFDGHFEIVKFLVENGADIEIANKHGHTCLMISCFKRHYNIASYLIDRGCQINRQSVKGNTALHDCAESNSIDIMKLLVKNGALLKRDCFGLTPLMTASINGHLEIFNYLKSVFNCSIEEQVDAYKLLGATFVDKLYNKSEAFKYWQNAAILSEKCSKKYKDSLVNKNESYQRAYGNTSEFQTEKDLDSLLYDRESMKIQAMMIRERILGIHHPETYYFIRIHGASYVESGEYSKCLAIWMYNLEQQSNSKPLSDITQDSFVSMIDLFANICFQNESDLDACDIYKVLKMAISQVLISCDITPSLGQRSKMNRITDSKFLAEHKPYFMFFYGLDRQFLIILHLIGFMCQLQSKISVDEWHKFKESIRHFLSCDPRSSNSHSLLHIVCILSFDNEPLKSSETSETSLFDVFRLIVDLSQDLNVVDIRGNTPLHFLLEHNRSNYQMVHYLLEAGSHIDLCNNAGLTPLDFLKKKKNWQNLKIKYTSLQCLCAQTIIKHRISLNDLPKNLKTFVTNHLKKEFFSQTQ